MPRSEHAEMACGPMGGCRYTVIPRTAWSITRAASSSGTGAVTGASVPTAASIDTTLLAGDSPISPNAARTVSPT